MERSTASRRPKLAVVDDEPLCLSALQRVLRPHQGEVELVCLGDIDDVLVELERQRPDCVLVDLVMPHISGEELCRQLRQSAALRRARIVAMTGYASGAQVKRVLEAGAETCWRKPVPVQALLAAVGPGTQAPPAGQPMRASAAVAAINALPYGVLAIDDGWVVDRNGKAALLAPDLQPGTYLPPALAPTAERAGFTLDSRPELRFWFHEDPSSPARGVLEIRPNVLRENDVRQALEDARCTRTQVEVVLAKRRTGGTHSEVGKVLRPAMSARTVGNHLQAVYDKTGNPSFLKLMSWVAAKAAARRKSPSPPE